MPGVPRQCPRCGGANPASAEFCYLCQAPLAGEEGAAPLPGGSAITPATGRPPAAAVPPGAAPSAAPGVPPSAPSPSSTDAPHPAARPAAPPAPAGASAAVGSGDAPSFPGVRGRGEFLSFFEAQRENVHATVLLFVLLFAILVILGAVMGSYVRSPSAGIFLGVTVFVILASVAWFNGTSVVLALHGAHEANPAEHRVLLNVVDEMRIAAGLPMPKVYVMDTEGMNAFAAGREPKEAVVAVTTGLLARLDRHELQAVVAHELGHVGGRDTLYAVLAAVLVGSVALLSDFFLRGATMGVPRGRFSRGRGGGGGALLGLVLALVAPIAARILQMSISRQREYRADAASAAFTRNPGALASALGKISGGSADVPGANRGTQHLFIVNPLKEFTDASTELMSTHPPTVRRIERLRRMAGG